MIATSACKIQSSFEEDAKNDYGYFVGLDSSGPVMNYDCSTNEIKEKYLTSTDTNHGTFSTAPSSDVSVVSAIAVGSSDDKSHENACIVHEIGQRVNDSQSKIMDMIQSLFIEVLEGQKKINKNLDKICRRVDDIEKAISLPSSSGACHQILPSSPSADTVEYSYVQTNTIDFLRKLKISGKPLNEILKNPKDIDIMAKVCVTKTFFPGEMISREGEKSATFFIVKEGNINCYKKIYGAQPLISLTVGSSFGEGPIFNNTYIATSTVKCLCLLRKDFSKIFEKAIQSESHHYNQRMKNANINDFKLVRVLGTGNFSTVKLAKYSSSNDTIAGNNALYALKCFKDNNASDENSLKALNEVIENEKRITNQLESPFIVNFFGSIRSSNKVYFVLEAMLGGDLYQLLQKKTRFHEDWVRFYTASVLSAFEDIHSHKIAYRDLKPENLILTDQGYIKIIDFGLSKILDDETKSYTCCGTLDYLAPEIILKTGHDMAVDYWALGILMFEMAAGDCPFIAEGQIQTCQTILSGKINFPSYFSPVLCEIIKAFLQKDPSKRLGCIGFNSSNVVKTHEWLKDFDWFGLVQRKLRAPYIPKINDQDRMNDGGGSNTYFHSPFHTIEKIKEKQQRDIFAKMRNVNSMKQGTGKNLKVSMFGGYY